jgi:hypothetical protein
VPHLKYRHCTDLLVRDLLWILPISVSLVIVVNMQRVVHGTRYTRYAERAAVAEMAVESDDVCSRSEKSDVDKISARALEVHPIT